jgi:glycosyltransferase involved in cell wall biosynthesis
MTEAHLNLLPDPPKGRAGWPWTEAPAPVLVPAPPGTGPWPKISIVTPSFNQGQFLEETIRSVLLQNYPNLEYIVIDGGSSDGSLEILEKYAPWLTYWVSEPDSGQSEAINKGIDRCSGEIFNWLCSDDFLDPDALFTVAKTLGEGDAEVFCGVSRLLHCDGSVGYARTPVLDSVDRMIFIAHICQPATFFKGTIIRQLGHLNGSLHYCMDAEWWVKYLLAHGKEGIATSESVLVNYRFHEASKSVSDTVLFEHDFCAVKYAVLKLFGAPGFISRYYSAAQAAPLELSCGLGSVHGSIDRRQLISCYTRKSIKESFLRRELTSLACNLVYDAFLKRGTFFNYLTEILPRLSRRRTNRRGRGSAE